MAKEEDRNFVISRRAFVTGLSSSALVPASAWSATEPAKPEYIVINNSGGTAAAWMRKAYYDDFEKMYGIRVTETSPVNFSKLRAMVETGNIEWTVTELGAQDSVLAGEKGYLEPIDDKIVDRSKFLPIARDKFIFNINMYSTVLAYRTDAFEPGKQPKGWAAFWDVKKYPGPRALRNHPVANLEFALMAAGVPKDKLYPLDVDRAFKKLDEIKPHISVWWKTGAQPPQLLQNKEVVLTTGWHGRFFDLLQTNTPMAIEWTEGLLNQNCYGIPKGTKDAYWGQKLLALMAQPKGQAIYANGTGSPGNNEEAATLVDPKLLPLMPNSPQNLPKQTWSDNKWWGEHGHAALDRWNKWISS